MILTNGVRPGHKLVHDELAKALGVSRTPVREALERLQQEGFIVHIPRRGCFVNEITADEARELYGVREALEIYALRQTAKVGLTPANIRELAALLRKYAGLVKENAMRDRLLVDRDFHLALAAIPANRALSTTLEAVYERIFLKIRTEGFRTTQGVEGYEEHVALLDALKKPDFAKAEKMLAAHISDGRNRLLAHIADSVRSELRVIPLRPKKT